MVLGHRLGLPSIESTKRPLIGSGLWPIQASGFSELVTLGDHAAVDGTECGYLLRTFFQTRPLMREVGLVDVTYSGAAGRAVMAPWLEEE